MMRIGRSLLRPSLRAHSTSDVEPTEGKVAERAEPLTWSPHQRTLQGRHVLISQQAKSPMQSGTSGRVGAWRVDFVAQADMSPGAEAGDVGGEGALPSVGKWESPLMRWTSNGDPTQGLGNNGLRAFPTVDAAIEFAQSQGWTYRVQGSQPDSNVATPKSYADNFTFQRDTPKIAKTK